MRVFALSAVLIANATGTNVQDLFYVALLFAMIGGSLPFRSTSFSFKRLILCFMYTPHALNNRINPTITEDISCLIPACELIYVLPCSIVDTKNEDNILALALTTFLTTQINTLVFGTASDKFRLGVSERFTINGLADIPVIGAIFTNVYPFEVIIIVIAIFAWYLLYKTKFGMRLRLQ